MIDTINFRLNNVKRKYPIIYAQYSKIQRDGATVVSIDEETGETADNAKIRAILHHDSDTIVPISQRSSIYIGSSHYSVSYFFNYSGDFLDFNFSIPKYCYGSNIIQFIKYFSQDADTCYQYFRNFLTAFCKKHFFEPIDYKDVEITRIDLCYNQFFNSKYDALRYLGEQKQLLTKFARSTKNDFRSYDTSLVYLTKRYSFKIYHKGTEFKKHDKKELAKKNPTGHLIDDLQNISDKILRYEITFRKSQINYLFEKAQLYNSYVPDLVDRGMHTFTSIIDKEYYNKAMQFVEQSKAFILGDISNKDAIHLQSVTFTGSVFKLLYDYFWEYVKKYQLKQKVSLHDVLQKIDALNEKRDKAVSKQLRAKMSYNKPMVTVLALLTNHQSLDELRKSGLLAKATFYRYKKQLADLGIDSESRLEDMPPPALDYMDYKFYFGKHHTN